MKRNIFAAIIISLVSGQTLALGIDNMILISGQSDKGDYYNVVNDTEVPVYVKTEVSEVKYVNGKPVENVYARDNLKSWNITVNPGLFILDSGESKKVSVDLIDGKRNLARDEIYAISFLPQPHVTDKKETHQMSLQIGFKTYYIVPAHVSNVKYALDYDKKTGVLTVDNTGNTLVIVELNMCKANTDKKEKTQICDASFLAPAGRKKQFDVPKTLRQQTMKFDIINHNRSYRNSMKF